MFRALNHWGQKTTAKAFCGLAETSQKRKLRRLQTFNRYFSNPTAIDIIRKFIISFQPRLEARHKEMEPYLMRASEISLMKQVF